MKNALDLWSWEGVVSRGQYIAAGVVLAMFKYPLDLAVSRAFDRPWNPLMYVSLRMSPLLKPGIPGAYLLALLAVALPFMIAGVSLSARRLRDMGVHPFWSGLFFFPMLHWIFILVLAVCPPARAKDPAPEGGPYRISNRSEPELPRFSTRIIPESESGAFLFGLALTIGMGLACFVLAVQLDQTLGAGLFLGVPFGMGFTMGFCVNRHRQGVGWSNAGFGCVPSLVGLVALLVLAREGIACVVMASPIVFAMSAFGSWVGARCARSGSAPEVGGAIGLLLAPAAVALDYARAEGPETVSVESSIVVHAPANVVWQSLVAMPRIDAPPEPIFAIVAMPLEVRADGPEPGAARRWTFTNGDFITSVAAWDAPRELGLRVESQPRQLDHIVTITDGHFALTENPDGTTLVRGTMGYRLRLHPAAYWSRWTNLLLGAIHARVLEHVKRTAEHPPIDRGAPGPEMPGWMEASNATCPCTRHAAAR